MIFKEIGNVHDEENQRFQRIVPIKVSYRADRTFFTNNMHVLVTKEVKVLTAAVKILNPLGVSESMNSVVDTENRTALL